MNDRYNNLSTKEKAAIIKMAVSHGINTIPEIKEFYNNMYSDGGDISFQDWYKTIPKDRNDTTNYDLKRAYEVLPKEILERWRTATPKQLKRDDTISLPTVYNYRFLKSKNHPSIKEEYDWYNSEQGKYFKEKFLLDTTNTYPEYRLRSDGGNLEPSDSFNPLSSAGIDAIFKKQLQQAIHNQELRRLKEAENFKVGEEVRKAREEEENKSFIDRFVEGFHRSTNPAANTYKALSDNPQLIEPYKNLAMASLLPLGATGVGSLGTALATKFPKLARLGQLGMEGYGAASLIDDELSGKGVVKTARHIKEGEYKDAALSGLGDIFNWGTTALGIREIPGLHRASKYSRELIPSSTSFIPSAASEIPDLKKNTIKTPLFYKKYQGMNEKELEKVISQNIIDFYDSKPYKERVLNSLNREALRRKIDIEDLNVINEHNEVADILIDHAINRVKNISHAPLIGESKYYDNVAGLYHPQDHTYDVRSVEKLGLLPHIITLNHEVGGHAVSKDSLWGNSAARYLRNLNHNINPIIAPKVTPHSFSIFENLKNNPSSNINTSPARNHKSVMGKDYLTYRNTPEENRANAMSILINAHKQGLDINKLIDDPASFRAIKDKYFDIFTDQSVKDYMRKVISLGAPVGIGATMYNNRKNKNDNNQ